MIRVRPCNYKDLGEITDMMSAFQREESKIELFKTGRIATRNVVTGLLYGLDSLTLDVFVAEKDEELVGYTLINVKNQGYCGSLVIEEIYIKPKDRGIKIAGKLTRRVILHAISQDINQIYTEVRENNYANLRHNHKMGFLVERRERRGEQYFLVLKKDLVAEKQKAFYSPKTL